MRYPHLLAAIRSAKWAVTPATLQAIRDVLSSRLAGRAEAPVAAPPRPAALPVASAAPRGTAVVECFGIIGKRLSEMEMMCGGCDLGQVEEDLAAAVADPGTSAIILHLDSPGGTVTGVPELAAKIRAWSAQKPIYAFTDTLCASAAYWLAAACTGLACAPTAEVGSIGVYMALIDESEAWAKEGYKLVLVKAGARKAEGIPGSALSPETVAAWQAEVDAIYALFTADVAASRPGVAPAAMQGQTFMGAAALEAALVDAVVPDLAAFAALIAAPV